MKIEFNSELASALNEFAASLRANPGDASRFKEDPTGTTKAYLQGRGVQVPTPDMFHSHVIGSDNPLPDEPERATVDRYVYIFRKDGMFEFRTVPGTPNGNDDMMLKPTGACCCCNCCAVEL